MSNYTTENLVPFIPDSGALAIRIGEQVFAFNPTGGGATNFFKCVSVSSSPKTWTGYLASLVDGVYTFSSTVTGGLTYSSVTPQVGKVYNDGALIEAKLYTGIPDPNLYFTLADATESVTEAVLTNNGVTFGTDYAIFDGESYLAMPSAVYGAFDSVTSIFFCGWVKLDANAPSEQWLWSIGNGNTDFGVSVYSPDSIIYMAVRDYDTQWGVSHEISASIHDGTWHFIAFYSKSGGAQFACLDTTYQTNSNQRAFYSASKSRGTIGVRDNLSTDYFLGDMAQFRFMFGETLDLATFQNYCAAYKATFTPPSA